MKTPGLILFLKGNSDPKREMPGCANYDGGCLFEDECLVEQGQRCAYFEKSVLPTAGQLGLQSIYDTYEAFTGSGMLRRPQTRLCPDCSTILKPRQRVCEKCSAKRRQATYRKTRQKQTDGAQQLTKIAP